MVPTRVSSQTNGPPANITYLSKDGPIASVVFPMASRTGQAKETIIETCLAFAHPAISMAKRLELQDNIQLAMVARTF